EPWAERAGGATSAAPSFETLGLRPSPQDEAKSGRAAKNVLGSRRHRRYWRNARRRHAPHVTRAERSRRRSVRLGCVASSAWLEPMFSRFWFGDARSPGAGVVL